MCKFKSGIVLRTGKLLHSNYTDSHEHLISLFKIKDHREGNICRVEFYPEDPKDLDKPEKYALHIDESRTPDWFDEEAQEKTTREMRQIIQGMIVNGTVNILLSGAYILTDGANVGYTDHARLIIYGGTITAVCGGTITAVYGGTITDVRGGTITAVCGGTITAVCDGTITAVYGGTIGTVYGGTIGTVYGGTITAVCGGTITAVCDGTITAVCGGTILKDYRKKREK